MFGPVGGVGERGPALGGQLAAFTLVIGLEQQTLMIQDPQHGRGGHWVTAVPGHRPHLAVTPRRMRPGDHHHGITGAVPSRGRPRTLGWAPVCGPGLPTPVGPFGDADLAGEPRGRHPRIDPDYLEVLEGPSRPSALFFHTRSSTAASPSAWVEGPVRPAVNAVLPASTKSAFHRLIDASEIFSLRAASAIETSPDNTANTIRVLTFGRNDRRTTHQAPPQLKAIMPLTTGLPRSLKRDNMRTVSLAESAPSGRFRTVQLDTPCQPPPAQTPESRHAAGRLCDSETYARPQCVLPRSTKWKRPRVEGAADHQRPPS